MLVELAIGDAYGAGFEYVSNRLIRTQNTLAAYVQHPRHGTTPGCYTDDTQMTIALAEAIVADDPWTPERLAHRFVEAFKRDPREGYARRFHAFLQEVEDGTAFLEKIIPHSDKSGAAMRASVIGVFADVREVIERATVQAAITHDTPGGIQAAVAAALMPHYFLYGVGPRSELDRFLEAHVPGPWRERWTGKVGAKGLMSVHAAMTAIMAHDTLGTLLQGCVAFTGDVDTVATIALAAASCTPEFENDLPPHLYEDLENDQYGRTYLEELDARLLKQVTRS